MPTSVPRMMVTQYCGSFFQVCQHHERIDAGGAALEVQAFLDRHQNLADAEQADDGDQEVEAGEQRLGAEGEPQAAGDLVGADTGKGETEHHRRNHLERRLPAHADEGAEGQKIDGEVFRRAEIKREIGDDRRQESEHDGREQGADEGRRQRGGERLAGAALLRQRVPVEGGRHRPRFAWDVEQDRADAAAEQRPPVDRRQHDDGGGLVHREGQRQQDGDAVGAADAGQEAEQHAEQDADHHVAHIHGREQHLEAVQQRKERVQQGLPSPDAARSALKVRALWHFARFHSVCSALRSRPQ